MTNGTIAYVIIIILLIYRLVLSNVFRSVSWGLILILIGAIWQKCSDVFAIWFLDTVLK